MRFCPNLLVLNGNKNCGICLYSFVDKNKSLVPKFKKVSIYLAYNEISLMKTFVDYYKNTLKSLQLVSACFQTENQINEIQ